MNVWMDHIRALRGSPWGQSQTAHPRPGVPKSKLQPLSTTTGLELQNQLASATSLISTIEKHIDISSRVCGKSAPYFGVPSPGIACNSITHLPDPIRYAIIVSGFGKH